MNYTEMINHTISPRLAKVGPIVGYISALYPDFSAVYPPCCWKFVFVTLKEIET
jgi:hypothetical protein